MAEERRELHAWALKVAQGKMFQRLECDRCGGRFQFCEAPRVTRFPRCPWCGSLDAHPRAA